MPAQQKTEVLQDFSGGLNTLTAANRLDPKFLPSMTNIWNDDGAITKRPGQSRTSTTNTFWGRSYYGISLHKSVFSASEILLGYASAGILNNFLFYTADAVSVSRVFTNTAGTVTTSAGSATVVGVGTSFLTTASANAIFSVGNDIGLVSSVADDTHLTLIGNFASNNAGASYNIAPGWAGTKRVSYADMNSKCWICGIGSTAISFDGSFAAYVSAFPQAAYSITYKNYMFAAGTTANPSRVYWSSLKDPTTWPAANFVDVNPDDGFPIVGLVYDGQSIVILKTNSAWKLAGDTFDPANPTYTLTQIYTPSDFRVNSPQSWQLLSDGFIILGARGFYTYNGAGAFSKMFKYDIIRGEFTNIAFSNQGVIPTASAEPASIIVDGNYWLQVPYKLSTISTADKELTYVIDKSGAVWKWQATANGIISDFAYLKGTLYGVNSWSGGTPGIIQLDTGNSDAQTTAISGTFQTKIIEFANMQRFGRAYVYYKKQSAGNLTFSYSIDGGSFSSNTIDMTSGTGTDTKSSPIVIGQVGRTIQFQFSNAVAAQTFEIFGIEFEHQELRQ